MKANHRAATRIPYRDDLSPKTRSANGFRLPAKAIRIETVNRLRLHFKWTRMTKLDDGSWFVQGADGMRIYHDYELLELEHKTLKRAGRVTDTPLPTTPTLARINPITERAPATWFEAFCRTCPRGRLAAASSIRLAPVSNIDVANRHKRAMREWATVADVPFGFRRR